MTVPFTTDTTMLPRLLIAMTLIVAVQPGFGAPPGTSTPDEPVTMEHDCDHHQATEQVGEHCDTDGCQCSHACGGVMITTSTSRQPPQGSAEHTGAPVSPPLAAFSTNPWRPPSC
jgi:hypothetical protein